MQPSLAQTGKACCCVRLMEAEAPPDTAWTQDHEFGTNPFLHSMLSPGFSFPNPLEKIKTKNFPLCSTQRVGQWEKLNLSLTQPHTHLCSVGVGQ